MKLKALQTLAKEGESAKLEFKRSTAQLKGACETACALLNNQGGKVIIGVANDGHCVGQQVTDNTRKEIAHELSKIEPPIQVDVHYIPYKDKHIMVFDVPTGLHAPYIYDGRPFQRHESTTRRMAQQQYDQLVARRTQLNHSWEDVIATTHSVNDLDEEEIYKTMADGIRENRIPASAQREDAHAILQRLDLVVDGQLKRAAVVLYAKEGHLKFNQCTLRMARFKGRDKLGEFIDNQVAYGNSFRLLSDADAFLRRHLPVASFFKPDQFKRVDTPALPVMAVREALINALIHRDYADRTTDISLAIYDDRLELWNCGFLFHKLSLEALKRSHESVLKNKFIANVFYVRGLIEKWGTGINKMIDLCKEDGLLEPEFSERTGGLLVTFRFKEPIGYSYTEEVIVGEEINQKLRQKLILNFMKRVKTAPTQQIFDQFNSEFPGVTTIKTIRRDLNYLKTLGLIDSVGQKRNSAWVYKK